MWVLLNGIITALLGWVIIIKSEQIKSDEGEFYAFSTKWKIIAVGLSGVMAMRLISPQSTNMERLLLIGIAALFATQVVIDFNYKELADEWNLALCLLSLTMTLLNLSDGVFTHLVAWAVLTIFFFLWWACSNGLGFGDVKFIAATAFLLTKEQLIPYLIITLSLAVVYGIGVMIVQKKGLKSELPFGPFLILGMMAVGF